MGSGFLRQQRRNLLGPADPMSAARSRSVIFSDCLVIFLDPSRIPFLIVVILLNHNRHREARLDLRILIRIAQTETEYRIDPLRQAQ